MAPKSSATQRKSCTNNFAFDLDALVRAVGKAPDPRAWLTSRLTLMQHRAGHTTPGADQLYSLYSALPPNLKQRGITGNTTKSALLQHCVAAVMDLCDTQLAQSEAANDQSVAVQALVAQLQKQPEPQKWLSEQLERMPHRPGHASDGSRSLYDVYMSLPAEHQLPGINSRTAKEKLLQHCSEALLRLAGQFDLQAFITQLQIQPEPKQWLSEQLECMPHRAGRAWDGSRSLYDVYLSLPAEHQCTGINCRTSREKLLQHCSQAMLLLAGQLAGQHAEELAGQHAENNIASTFDLQALITEVQKQPNPSQWLRQHLSHKQRRGDCVEAGSHSLYDVYLSLPTEHHTADVNRRSSKALLLNVCHNAVLLLARPLPDTANKLCFDLQQLIQEVQSQAEPQQWLRKHLESMTYQRGAADTAAGDLYVVYASLPKTIRLPMRVTENSKKTHAGGSCDTCCHASCFSHAACCCIC